MILNLFLINKHEFSKLYAFSIVQLSDIVCGGGTKVVISLKIRSKIYFIKLVI